MSRLAFGIGLWFACYGVLSFVTDQIRAHGNRFLRGRGHDTVDCDICSGRALRRHRRELMKP